MLKNIYLPFLFLFFSLNLHADLPKNFPVNPTTIPEYDSVAGVVMYWSPYSNHQYDEIAVAVIDGIQSRATVFMQTNSESHRSDMVNSLNYHEVPLDNVVFIMVNGYRIWVRDHGPFSIYDDGELAIVGFDDLATNHGDQDLPHRLAQYWDLNFYDFTNIIFDGGNYLVDSHGRLFATDRLYSNNPGIPPAEIDSILANYMNIHEIYTFSALSSDYWGHLDMQVKLLNDTTFIISTVDEWHNDHQILENNYQTLLNIDHPEGKEYSIHKIPKAENWKTYINSLIVNDAVLVPIYNDERDSLALATYENLMPGKEVIGIDCNAMIGWEGAIHCITNQLPPFQQDTGDDDNDNGDDDNGDDDNGDDDNGDDDNGDDDNGDDDDSTSVTDPDSKAGASGLEIFPNPATDKAFAEFKISSQGDYVLTITDLSGQLLRRVNIPAWYTGTYSVAIDAASKEAGIYMITLKGENQFETKKLIIQ